MDSISRKGVDELKNLIIETLKYQEMRDIRGAFRLPIDQVFSVKGQGTVVKGTVYEGHVSEGNLKSDAKRTEREGETNSSPSSSSSRSICWSKSCN